MYGAKRTIDGRELNTHTKKSKEELKEEINNINVTDIEQIRRSRKHFTKDPRDSF